MKTKAEGRAKRAPCRHRSLGCPLWAIALGAASATAACAGDEHDRRDAAAVDLRAEAAQEDGAPSTARALAVHVSPSAPRIVVEIAGVELDANGLPFGASTRYTQVPSGEVQVEVRAAAGGAVLLREDVQLASEVSHSIFVVGAQSALDLVVLEDRPLKLESYEAGLRFAHLAPGAPELTVTANGALTLFRGAAFAYGQASPFERVDAAVYDAISAQRGDTPLASIENIRLVELTLRTVFVHATQGGDGVTASIMDNYLQ